MRHELLGKLLEDNELLLRQLIGESESLSIAPSARSLRVKCDPNLFLQAVANLAQNARESYPGGQGKVEISLDEETIEREVAYLHPGAHPGHYARLSVRDHGKGMSTETLSKAFDPLFTTKTFGGHAGLGLSIVHAIVRAHDGFLTVESHVEKGTTVSVYIPARDEATDSLDTGRQVTEDDQPIDDQDGAVDATTRSILVVDDEDSVRNLVEKILTRLGYKVTSCSDRTEALESATERSFDLVVLNSCLPGMNGLRLIDELRETKHAAKFLVMTSSATSPDQPTPGTALLKKPFDYATLAASVRGSLGGISESIESA
jgi:CheY-like chemotaxis protein